MPVKISRTPDARMTARPHSNRTQLSSSRSVRGNQRSAYRAARKARYSPPSRIGGWNASPVSQGKKIQVSCDTSVMKVSTIGRPCGLA